MNLKKLINSFTKVKQSEKKKNQELQKLDKWIDGILLNATYVAESNSGTNLGHANTTLSLKMDNLNKDDLEIVKPSLIKLHEACKKADILLELAGFDLLPETRTINNNVKVKDNTDKEINFAIYLDNNQSYKNIEPNHTNNRKLGIKK